METADSTGSADFELVDDVLDGLDITDAERSRIEDRTSELLTLDACLKNLRIAAGVLQKDVAIAMGVTKSSVAQLEARGLADAKLSTLTRYFAGLGYKLNFTLTPIDA
ncbi:helix-turn-helix domain-containing protein [Candidatus Poriferisodalis sp.]|uniref:helix-turn-helix domain-containing protein n=1 Tax=Candidatus Poriferisodalis sp. TaxID=3101277 RepID=UPI003B52D23B